MVKKPRYKAVRIDPDEDADAILEWQRICFAGDQVLPPEDAMWWFLYDEAGLAVAFIGYKNVDAKYAGSSMTAYLARVGVLPSHRGLRLQKLIQDRTVQAVKRLGYFTIITYTWNNPKSANSLISSGYRNYMPAELWATDQVVYWHKKL
jgi:GNAT superfamily N-acetyltransferase